MNVKTNINQVPDQLKDVDHWIGWRSEKRDGKPTKVPYNPTTGKLASSTDPATWTDFDTVKNSSKYGLGFVLTNSPYTGIDLDGCRNPDTGEIAQKAWKIVKWLDSYTEISPSGTGLHVIVKGKFTGDGNKTGDVEGFKELEMYYTARYFTVTGNHLEGTPKTIKERTEALQKLHDRYFGSQPNDKSLEKLAGKGTGLSDNEVLKLARNAKNGDKFERLWRGDTSSYPSHSEADLSLCSHLAFYTGPDPGRIDRLFRQSKLCRDKWTDRPDYRERTIKKALEGTTEFYEPSTQKEGAKPKRKSKKNKDSGAKDQKLTQAQIMLKFARKHGEYFHDQFDVPHVKLERKDHKEIWPVRSTPFRKWFLSKFFEIKEGKPPSAEALNQAQICLEADGFFEGQRETLKNRVAQTDEALWYDLANGKWEAIKTTEEGWEVTEPPILFRRFTHQKGQVKPTKSGSIEALEQYLHIPKEDLILVYTILVSMLVPDIPHPILILQGPQGSAKSFCFKVLRDLVDPSKAPLLTKPRSEEQAIQTCSHNYWGIFDNLSNIPAWLSDLFCRVVTGAGYSKRKLYSDDETFIYNFQHAVGLNGIALSGLRHDLLDRTIQIELTRIPEKDQEKEDMLWEAYQTIKPTVLGGMFNLLSEAIKIRNTQRLPAYPRMADFYDWGVAIAKALGDRDREFKEAYYSKIEQTHLMAIEASPFAEAVLTLVQKENHWSGRARELLDKCETIADQEGLNTDSKLWPGNAAWASKRLKEAQNNLEELGVDITFAHMGNIREITLTENDSNDS